MKSVFLDQDSVGHDVDIEPLRKCLPELAVYPDTEANRIDERIVDAEVAIINKVRLNETALRSARNLRLVCLAATGTDNVDLDCARELGIAVCNIRNYCTPSVVQHVFGLILALNQCLRQYDALLKSGAWSRSNQFCLLDFPFRELSGRTLGIVGHGALGAGVAAAGRAFGLQLIAAQHGKRANDSGDIRRVPLDELLSEAHIVSLHCPLTSDTANMIDATAFARMRNDALLINTARGGLVDSAALVEALQSGQIAGAGIDVLPVEPPVDSDPLLEARLPNLIVTPHIAWAAREARQRAIDEMAANIAAFLAGERRNRVI